MAVDRHPSRKPSLPRKPPATSTTDGQANTVSKTMTGSGWMEYGSRNGKDLRVKPSPGSERAFDFANYGTDPSGRKSGKVGKEAPNEGKASRASRPGDEKSNDEPG